jgi:hypothetical protein
LGCHIRRQYHPGNPEKHYYENLHLQNAWNLVIVDGFVDLEIVAERSAVKKYYSTAFAIAELTNDLVRNHRHDGQSPFPTIS